LTLAACNDDSSGNGFNPDIAAEDQPTSTGSADSGTTGSTTTPPAVNPARFSAPFLIGAASRGAVAGFGSYVDSQLGGADASRWVQGTDGAVTTLDTYRLGESPTVSEISGDATFAMGRWSKGRVVKDGAEVAVLTGTNARSFHYLAYNRLAAVPATVPHGCDAGTFTAPTPRNGDSAATTAPLGTTTGNAALTWAPGTSSVNVKLNLTTTVNGVSQPSTHEVSLTSLTGTSFSGNFFGQGSGSAIFLGDGGSGAVLVGAFYRVLLQSGSVYEGVVKFRCS
jgi:hypothetical protein